MKNIIQTIAILLITITSYGQTVHRASPITNVYIPANKKSTFTLGYNALQGGTLELNYKIREDLRIVSSLAFDHKPVEDILLFGGSFSGNQKNNLFNIGVSKLIPLHTFNNFLEIQSGIALSDFQHNTISDQQTEGIEQPENNYHISGLSLSSSLIHHWVKNSRDFYLGLRADVTHHHRFEVEDAWLDRKHNKKGTILPSIGPVVGINANISRFTFGSQLGLNFRKGVKISETLNEAYYQSTSSMYTQGTSVNFIIRAGYSIF